ncbi:putative ribonuclease H-like domain-containing protein [Tanacetum coccineum]
MSDESLVIPLEELRVDDKLHFVEEPVEVVDREIKQFERVSIPFKVRGDFKRGHEFYWERADQFQRRSSGPDWLFDIDALTRTMNYEPIVAGTQSNDFAGTKASDNAGQARKETEPVKDYILLPLWIADPPFSQDPKSSYDDGSKPSSDDGNKVDEDPRKESECNDQEKEDNVNNTNNVNAAGTNEVNIVGGKTSIELPYDPNMPALEDDSIFDFTRDDEFDGVVADMNNLDTTIQIEEEVYVCQPLGFEDPDFPNRVYKVEKALDYIKLLELVYVDDIIFGSTNKELCNAFKKLMHEKFQMSSMGELTFFLGLQVQQKKDDIFISQDKYVVEILKKFGFTKVKTASTLVAVLYT